MWGGSFIWLFPLFDLRHVAAASAYREDCAQSARHKFESAALAWKIWFSPEIIVIQKKLLSKAATVLFVFFCILAHDAFRPIKPIIPKNTWHVTTNVWIIMIQETHMCVNMCQPHGIKFFCPGPSARPPWHLHQGFNRRGLRPLDVFAQAPAKWTCLDCMSICIVWTAPKLRGLAIDYCLTCEIESSHNLPKVKTSRQFQRFFWAQVRSLEKRSIFHVLIPNQSGFPMLQHATNVVVLEVANLDPAWGV